MSVIVDYSPFERLAMVLLFNFVVPASDHFSFSFKVCGFCLFEDIDEVLALLNLLVGCL